MIPFPVSQNFRAQTLGYKFTVDKKFLQRPVRPNNEIFTQTNNLNYPIFSNNFYQYNFVYIFNLDDFVNPTPEKMRRAEHVAHDQIRLNFRVDLITPSGKTITPGYILDHPEIFNNYSVQYGKEGIQLKTYEQYVINQLPTILNVWPVNMEKVAYNHPEYNISEFDYIDLKGNMTKKTGTFGAIKYIHHHYDCCGRTACNRLCQDKVIFWGTGLKEYIPLPTKNIAKVQMSKDIIQPITTNYIFQTLGTSVVLDKKLLASGVTPNTELIKQLRNSSYYDLKGNSYKYMFVYLLTLEQFVTQTDFDNVQIISFDQVRWNFSTQLIKPNGKTITIGDIINNPEYSKRLSKQYGKDGITLGEYMNFIKENSFYQIAQQCPINMTATNEYNPEYYLPTYDILAINGTRDVKTSNVCAVKFTDLTDNVQKVFLFGSGLSEYVAG